MLDAILDNKRRELETLVDVPHELLSPCTRDFCAALRGPGLAIIAEVKRRSPSAGALVERLDPRAQAQAYAEGGAAAISVLTDARFFGGSYDDLAAVSAEVVLPALCKDFILDGRQVRHARRAGASACLLIVAALSDQALERLMGVTCDLGMAPLVEVHDEPELQRAVRAGATLIGVNNRDLRTMHVDRSTVPRLAGLMPPHCLLVAESGYNSARRLMELPRRVDAVLVGSALMQAGDPAATLHAWRRDLRNAARLDALHVPDPSDSKPADTDPRCA